MEVDYRLKLPAIVKATLTLSVICILLCISPGCEGKKIPRWWMKVAQRQGPNACVVEEVPGTGLEFWTECKYWLNRNICGRKTIARFECCEGFEQIGGETGCTRVKPLLNLLDTAEALGATRWAAYIRESGLANELETSGAYTLFAPTNDAFDSVKASLQSQLDSYRGNPNNPILLYHILPTKLDSDVFQANTVIETKHQGNFLRINKYSNGMNTINCALLLQKDQQATNGIVHIIDNVLDPSKSLSDNVADMLLKDGRFTVLTEMLEKSGYINVLRTMQGSVTFLAPSDEAFQKLPDSRREKIMNDREARLALIQNHIIPHVICESAITGEHRVSTVDNNKLTFNCDITGAYVEASKMRGNFNLGKNGIIHTLDDVLLPDRAKNLVELAESRQLFTFVELVKKAGLEETLSHTGDYTFFVPDETAWFELDPNILQRARTDVEFAGLLLRFHGAYGRHLTNSITDNQAIMSLDEENPLRLQVWRGALGVEDARITDPDIEAQNGVIHIINKLIFPSNESAADTLRSLPGRDTFDTYLDLLQKTVSQSPPVLNLGPGDDSFYTFLVPTDQAFGRMDANMRADLRSGGVSTATEFIKKHIAVNMYPPTSFEPNLIYSLEDMDGSKFNIKKSGEGLLTANGIPVSGSHMSGNGVIHVINEVFEVSGNLYHGGRRGGGSSSSSIRTSYGRGNIGSSVSRGEAPLRGDIGSSEGDDGTGSSSSSSSSSSSHSSSSSGGNGPNRRRGRTRSNERRRGVHSVPSNFGLMETERQLEIARLEEVEKQRQIQRLQEELEREEQELIEQRQNELRKLREENRRIEEENRRVELESRRREEQRIIEENRRVAVEGRLPSPSTRAPFQWESSPPSSLVDGGTGKESLTVHESGLYNTNNSIRAPVLNSSTSSHFITRTVTRNTVGPVSPNGTRFNYVGRSYGNDIVGHENDNNNINPLVKNGAILGKFNITDLGANGDIISRGFTTTRKRVNVTRTVYSYPDPRGGSRALSSHFFSRKNNQFKNSFGKNMKGIGNKNDFVSAYAFTGGETEYADGQEFAEAGTPVIATITVNQARALRRQWRRKRHQMLHPGGNYKKFRRRMRKGRGRRMRKGMRKRQMKNDIE